MQIKNPINFSQWDYYFENISLHQNLHFDISRRSPIDLIKIQQGGNGRFRKLCIDKIKASYFNCILYQSE